MPDTAKIRELNDQFRKTMIGGRAVMTPGIADPSSVTSLR